MLGWENKVIFWTAFSKLSYVPDISLVGLTKMPQIINNTQLIPLYFMADYELEDTYPCHGCVGDWMPWITDGPHCYYVNINPESPNHEKILIANYPSSLSTYKLSD